MSSSSTCRSQTAEVISGNDDVDEDDEEEGDDDVDDDEEEEEDCADGKHYYDKSVVCLRLAGQWAELKL